MSPIINVFCIESTPGHGNDACTFVPCRQQMMLIIYSPCYCSNDCNSQKQEEKPLGSRGVEKIIAGYYRQAKIFGASVHSLRHTLMAISIPLEPSQASYPFLKTSSNFFKSCKRTGKQSRF